MHASLGEIETVYRSSGDGFYRLALARLGDVEAAHDAVQEGFARAIRGRKSYRGSGSIEGWVARCVINAAHDLGRRGDPTKPLDIEAVSDPANVPDRVEDSGVREAVGRLPQRQRDVLFLRHYLDFDYATIAASLGIEVGTVSATLHAARSALAQELEEVAG